MSRGTSVVVHRGRGNQYAWVPARRMFFNTFSREAFRVHVATVGGGGTKHQPSRNKPQGAADSVKPDDPDSIAFTGSLSN